MAEGKKMFWKRKQPKFVPALQEALPDGFTLPAELWAYMQWLEDKGQCFTYRNSTTVFMPTTPVKSMDHLWSHLVFEIPPDLVRHWFGKDGLESVLVPLIKCGADGSYFAIWKDGEDDVFVFLGSEGEAFSVTRDVRQFLVLITMGYFSIEGRFVLAFPPCEDFPTAKGRDWPDPTEAKQHLQSTLGVTYPELGEMLLPVGEDDPFAAFVARMLGRA